MSAIPLTGSSALAVENNRLRAENERLRKAVLNQCGDNLCRLTEDDITGFESGIVPIPPAEEFLESCRRFHAQLASATGTLAGSMTIAQLEAEVERLRAGNRRGPALRKDNWLGKEISECGSDSPILHLALQWMRRARSRRPNCNASGSLRRLRGERGRDQPHSGGSH